MGLKFVYEESKKVFCLTFVYEDSKEDFWKDTIKEELHRGVVKLTFIKSNGSEREMICTLNENMIPEVPKLSAVNIRPVRTKVPNVDVEPVFDVEAEGWRSFRWDSLTKIEF